MYGRWLNKFPKYASYFEASTVRRIMETAQSETKYKKALLILWLGFRSGARLNELMLLRIEEAWDGYVPVWHERTREVKYVCVCKDIKELEWLRGQIEGMKSVRTLIDVKAYSIDRWVRNICKRAGVEIGECEGYSAVIRPDEERTQAKADEYAEEFVI